jgi:hypothetical protein
MQEYKHSSGGYPTEEIKPRMKNVLMYVFEEKVQKLKIRLPSKGSSITVNKSRHLRNCINNSWVWFGSRFGPK